MLWTYSSSAMNLTERYEKIYLSLQKVSERIQPRTHEKETIALPEQGIVEELAMAALPTPQKGNRNCQMLISERIKLLYKKYVHLSQCFAGHTCFPIVAMQCVKLEVYKNRWALSLKQQLDTLRIKTWTARREDTLRQAGQSSKAK